MNFNMSRKPEYTLFKTVSRELIDLYGVKCKFVEVEKVNINTITNEWTHIKTDGKKIHDIYILPEDPTGFTTQEYQFTDLGFVPNNNITCYVSASALDEITGKNKVISNLIVLPSNKVMEITDLDVETQQVNNLYTYGDDKTAYKLTLVPYEFKLHDKITDKHLLSEVHPNYEEEEVIGELKTSLYKHTEKKIYTTKTAKELEQITRDNYKALDDYLNSLDNTKVQQDIDGFPVYDQTEKDIWHGQ